MQATIHPAVEGYVVSVPRIKGVTFAYITGHNDSAIILHGTPDELIKLGADIERAAREKAGEAAVREMDAASK